MLAIPCNEEITSVIRSKCKVQSVSERVRWHEQLLCVGLSDLRYGPINGKKHDVIEKANCILTTREIAIL
jgi:hypothetical protein